jgi:hypothetical protein
LLPIFLRAAASSGRLRLDRPPPPRTNLLRRRRSLSDRGGDPGDGKPSDRSTFRRAARKSPKERVERHQRGFRRVDPCARQSNLRRAGTERWAPIAPRVERANRARGRPQLIVRVFELTVKNYRQPTVYLDVHNDPQSNVRRHGRKRDGATPRHAAPPIVSTLRDSKFSGRPISGLTVTASTLLFIPRRAHRPIGPLPFFRPRNAATDG